MKININKNKEEGISDKLIRDTARQTLQELRQIGKTSNKLNIDISFALVDGNEISKLNQQYRQQSGPTDVLSFSYEQNDENLEGEIILCPEIIKENALQDKIEFTEELSRNIIHGILHLMGYEHGEDMFNLQNKILKSK